MRRSILLAIALSSPVWCAQGVLTADTFITSANAAGNYGGNGQLAVGNGASSLVQFSLNELPPSLQSANIAKATLLLYVNRVTTAGGVSIARLAGTFAESTVTQGNSSGLIGTTIAGPLALTAASTGTYISIDVTASVQLSLLSGVAGFAVISDGTALVQFDSKENTLSSHPPELLVTLVSVGPQGPKGDTGAPGAQGLQGIQGIQGPVGPTGPGATFSDSIAFYTVPASTGARLGFSCGSGLPVGGGCGYDAFDIGVADVTVANIGRDSANPAFYVCSVWNKGTVSRTVRYSVTCRNPVAAGGAASSVTSAAQPAGPEVLPPQTFPLK